MADDSTHVPSISDRFGGGGRAWGPTIVAAAASPRGFAGGGEPIAGPASCFETAAARPPQYEAYCTVSVGKPHAEERRRRVSKHGVFRSTTPKRLSCTTVYARRGSRHSTATIAVPMPRMTKTERTQGREGKT